MNQDGGFLRNLFSNDEGEIRSGWRAFSFYLLFVIILLMLNSLAAAVAQVPAIGIELSPPQPTRPATGRDMLVMGIIWTLQLVSAIIASAICVRALERRSFASIGFKLHRGWVRDFLYGSLAGGATLALAVAIAAATGAMQIGQQETDPARLAIGFLSLSITLFIAAAFEELILRGFPFQALVHNIGPVMTVAITSILFGLLHYRNPDVTLLSTFNTTLAGVWLAVAYLLTRSLWLTTALHYSWNLAMVFVFGLPVSGITMYSHMAWLDARPGDPVWVSGGGYGPEGGIAATLALVASILFIWKSGLFSPSGEMLSAIRHGSIDATEDGPADA